MDKEYLLRHLLATIKYRISLVIKEVPIDYPDIIIGNGVRTPIEILRHMTNLLRRIQSELKPETPQQSIPQSWEEEVVIFFNELQKSDDLFKLQKIPNNNQLIETLVQGPIADALTHVGQLAMIRRMAGSPVRAENYMKADITIE